MDVDRPKWTIVIIAPDPAAPRREVHLTDRHVRAIRWAVIGAVLAFVALLLGFGVTYPRSRAYGELLQENLGMKLQLAQLDARMSDIDRILLRLRLYDAQLKGLNPKGDHGPVDVSELVPGRPQDHVVPNSVESQFDPDEDDLDGSPGVWGSALLRRADAFVALFHHLEPEYTKMFGELEDLHAIDAALPSRWPTHGLLSSDYGWRRNPFSYRRWKFHSGLDIANDVGTPIHAVARGVVIRAGWVDGYGNAVEIDHGFGISTLYGHNSRLMVQVGDAVAAGDPIAAMGSTGHSTGPHCHFEIRIDGNPVDPRDYLKGQPAP